MTFHDNFTLEMFPGTYTTGTQSNEEEFMNQSDLDKSIDSEIDDILNFPFSSPFPNVDLCDNVKLEDEAYVSYESLDKFIQDHDRNRVCGVTAKEESTDFANPVSDNRLNSAFSNVGDSGGPSFQMEYNWSNVLEPAKSNPIESASYNIPNSESDNRFSSVQGTGLKEEITHTPYIRPNFNQESAQENTPNNLVSSVAREILSNSQYDTNAMLQALLSQMYANTQPLQQDPNNNVSFTHAGDFIDDKAQITPQSIEVSPDIEKSVRRDQSSVTEANDVSESSELTTLGRFQVNPMVVSFLKLTLEVSAVQCLAVVINYHGYRGNIVSAGRPDYKMLSNQACTIHEYHNLSVKPERMLSLDDGRPSEISCTLQRIRYTRNIDEILNSVSCIAYCESGVFNPKNPYEPQYYRFELTESGKRINGSKCGLCPYCEEVKFLPFKNSSYLSHLTLEHGIFSNNYLIPDCLYYGYYLTSKLTTNVNVGEEGSLSFHNGADRGSQSKRHKVRRTKAIQCPACFKVIEVGCWSMKTNPLLSYFRHFKKVHSNLTVKSKGGTVFNTNKFINITKRGRTLKPKQ